MCGRFSFAVKARIIEDRFDIEVDESALRPRYNCAPSQLLAVISNESPGRLSYYRWGLIPVWAKDASIGNKTINAKAETVAEKPSFRVPFSRKRCLVPADGFYEWKHESGRQPYRFMMRDGAPFAMAGIWDAWRNERDEEVRSFSIITTMANELVAGVHHRMPVILRREDEQAWLSPVPLEALTEMLEPYPAKEMQAYRISTMVNSPAQDLPEIWEPLG